MSSGERETILKTFLTSLLGGIVAFLLFLIITPLILFMVIGGIASNAGKAPNLPAEMVLKIDLRESISDQAATAGPAVLFQQNSFLGMLKKLDAAATDKRVKGVFIRASEFGLGSSRAEELRQALQKLRDNDKFVVAHSQGMLGSGPSGLRAISAADEIWLQPGSDMLINGIAFETLFMKDLFDNLSITAEIEQFHEYKNAPNVYKQTDYTDSHREAMTVLATDIWTISLEDIAQDRGFESTAALKVLLEAGPMSDQEAVDSGLVTGLKWPEDASEATLKQGGDNAEYIEISAYSPPPPELNAPTIAVVGGEGPIITGSGDQGFFNSDPVFASDQIAQALLDAGNDEKVRAIVFRVDSPGGSAIASDQIWRAVMRVREDMKKPVVVSMGSVAASGGYYVSAGADAILASRTTITGSIGVFGGKLAIADGLRRIGINPSTIAVGGDFAGAFNTEAFTEEQRAQLRESLERIYDRFMMIVATGRELPEERVREIARGRVWSGEDAADLSLVTEIGGYIDAIAKAKELASIAPETDVRIVNYPAQGNPFEAFGALFGASAETAEAAARLNEVLGDENFQALMQQGKAMQRGEAQMSAPVMIEN